MPAPVPLQRQIGLAQFPGFARNLTAALAAAGVSPRDISVTCAAHLSAKCVLCGARLDGRELAALLTADELPEASPLRRLSQGYCVSEGCKSSYYEFTCLPHPSLDWSSVSADEAIVPVAPTSDVRWAGVALRALGHKIGAAFTWRFAAGLGVLLALWLWQQWWTGGSIPFLREAHPFESSGVSGDIPVMDDDADK
jgi:hypothetical protein